MALKNLAECKQYTVYCENEKVYDVLAEDMITACQEFIGSRNAEIKCSGRIAEICFDDSGECYVLREEIL